jgi:hypothetical protein
MVGRPMNTFITDHTLEKRLRKAISVAWAAFARKVEVD